MKTHVMLTVTSLLTILLLTLHLADDIVRGYSPGGPANMIGMLVLAGWVFGTLVFAGRRSGYVINLVLALLASGIPLIHMTGLGLGQGRSTGAFFFIWTLLALGVTTLLSVMLSARGLWSLRSGQPR